MQNILVSCIEKIKSERTARHKLLCIMLALSLIVAICVYWQLKLTGVALANEYYCGLEEHTHNDECYEYVLVCGYEESEVTGHVHTDECYLSESVLVCGLEESEGHTHTEACYEIQQTLICTEEESEGHVHTDECYELQPTCGFEEHTHSVECMIDETADLETAEIWEATLPELTGVWADDVVSIARSQLGYAESTANYTIADDGETHKGYTRYGEWAGNPYGDWDGMFASFCLSYAGISRETFPESTGAYAWSVELRNLELFAEATDYSPEAGDLIFFDKDSDGKIDHVGIIETNDGITLTVIEGNVDDAVSETCYAISDISILGYGVLPEQSAEEETEFSEQTLTVWSDNALITISGSLPERAVVTAIPVDVEEVEIEGKEVLLAFDISITYQDGSGETVVFEPESGTISVTIESSEITGGSDVYYVPDEGEPEKLENDSEDGAIAFDAEHFSTYAVTSSDTVVATGTIDNAEGDEDAITWTVYEDSESGERKLVISGTGSIPDYTDGSETPWYGYCSTSANRLNLLVIDEGITAVGDYAFHLNYISEISFPDTLTSIHQFAFYRLSSLTSVTIPDSVIEIGKRAFSGINLIDIDLGEGVQTIGDYAFYGNFPGTEVTIHIPDSLTSFGISAFSQASAYAISSTNTNFYVDSDGVLYSYDKTTLIDYPKNREVDSWIVPTTVTTIKEGALQNVKKTGAIYFYHQVQLCYQCFRESVFSYAYFYNDFVLTGSNLFAGATNLTSVHLPENATYTIPGYCFSGCTSLQELNIPQGVTSIGGYSLNNTTNLETLYFDAEKATINAATFGTESTTLPLYDLTIGKNVDYLVANFSYILEHASTLTIEGPNAFYVADGAFANAPAPYTGLSGWIYVDGDGVIYTLDTATNEATLIYVPDSVKSLTIPATITDTLDGSEDVTFTVTSVAKDALKEASSLTSVIFGDASNITSLGAYALANAPIESVTDEASSKTVYTVDEAMALFTNSNITIGYNVFYNTALTGSVQATDFSTTMDGEESVTYGDLSITVTQGSTTKWQDNTSGGGYVSLTGDSVGFGINASNNSGDNETYRIYIQVTDDDCSTGYTAGTTYDVNGVDVTAVATDDPYTIYLEFTVETGNTVNFTINTFYPSPDSDGGGVTIWGAVVDDSGTVTAETDEIDASWTTQQDTYTIAKTNNNQTSVSITASSDDRKVHPSTTMRWLITLSGEDYSTAYGEDYVTVATYTDVMTLPTGMAWDTDILAKIKEGSVTLRSNALYVGSTEIASLSLSSNSSLSLSGLSISYDETSEQVVIKWKVRNTGSVNMQTNTLTLYIYPEALTVDMDTYSTSATNTITNTATATLTYTYGSSEVLASASAEKSVTGGSGNIKVSKTGTDVTFFGEDLTYTVSVYNNGGLPYTDTQPYTLTDALVNYLYISAENMEKMFEEAAAVTGTELTITISGAKLADSGGSTVTDTDGDENSVYVNTGNSTLSDESSNNTLVITYDSDSKEYTVTVSGNVTGAYTGTSLENILQEDLGYGVTSAVTYSCVWTLPDDGSGNFVLASGGDYTYNIYATVKSTFQILDDYDTPNKYLSSSTITLQNRATVKDANGKQIAYINASNDYIRREAILSKSVSLDGTDLGSSPMASDGDVLDYTLKFVHYGDGTYDDLPMVDDLYGSQYLLVPYNENSANSTVNGCKTYDIGDDKYYILSEGTYTNVVVGQDEDGKLLTAATITVTSGTNETFNINSDSYTWSGVHTQIKWYFDHLDGGYYEIKVSYKALVSTDNAMSYSIGNIVWMNDRIGSCLYDTLWGGGTILDFDKDIVVTKGSDSDADVLDDDKHTIISEGETVTYRLTLKSTGDLGQVTLTGKNIADQLPDTYNAFSWTTSNVNISSVVVDTSGGGSVSNYDSLSSNWSIGSYNSIDGCIIWDDSVEVTFSGNATVYIYVELTYPSGTDWDNYVEAAQGASISNTLYIYRNPINVTHVLASKGEATLQKGVYALLRKEITTSSNYYYYATGTSRSYYNNQDSNYRYVAYYVSIYNEGSTRLYLNDLYDELPEGFSFVSLASSYTPGSTLSSISMITTLSGIGGSSSFDNWFVETDSGTKYMSATVTANTSSDGTLVFSISSGSGTYVLSYDAEMGQYYLNSGEAIVFGYICQIGLTADTKDVATNTIAMSYTDYTGSGVDVSSKSFDARDYSPYGSSNNDGSCTIETSVSADLDDGNGNSEWLVSSVSLERGGIKPGVKKDTVSYQATSTSTAETYTNSVKSTDLVNWKATLLNGGTMSIVDYIVTDVMPNPYVFTGPVKFEIFDSSNASQSSGTLFTVNTDSLGSLPKLDSSTLTSLSVTSYTSSGSSTATTTTTVTIGGGWVEGLWAKTTDSIAVSFNLRFYFDSSNNLVMEIQMTDEGLAVPEGGSMTITYTSWNPTTSYSSITYINQVTLTPSQSFTSSDIQSGSAVKDDSGNLTGVSAISPVTVSSGYATNSYKTVTESSNASNTATSNSSDNSIVLESSNSTFTYTLSVENVNSTAISKLVIIDNLPCDGDKYTYNEEISRDSEFSVALASSDFVVKIGDDTLTSGYTVEYCSTKSGNFSSDDRDGTSTSDWSELTSTTTLSDVKSIRVIITESIPAGKTVSVSFSAKISDSGVEPGQVAWNSFGYWYEIGSSPSVSLEAMTLVVGVKTPSMPELTKTLVDLAGDSYTVADDTEFTFVVYEGEELKNNGESYKSQTDLVNALIYDNREYRIVTLTVNAGDSASGTLVLTDDNGLDSGSWWTWVNGDEYTIAEFVTDNNYDFGEWDEGNSRLSTSNSYTFTYNSATTLSLTCTNVYETWELTLTKVELDNTSNTLEGAVFALYTDDENQKMSDTVYTSLTIQPNKEITIGNSTWYLMSVGTTGNGGIITWSELTGESYYLVEVKAPDGYNVDTTPLLVERSEDSNSRSITVENTPGVELPEAGGINLQVVYAVGSLMIIASAIGLVVRRKKI